MAVPKLRFKADDGSVFPDWEEKKLEDITKKISRKDENSNADVRMISQGNGFILQATKYSRENAGQSLKKYTLLKSNEFAYNHGASKAKPYGVCYRLSESDEARVPYVYHTFKLTKGNVDYWNYALNTSYMDRQLKKLVSSGVRMDGLLNINYDSYMSVKIRVPSLPEQQKIAEFLSTIDTVIAKQKETVSAWEERKKGVMQKLFSQEVRFKADDGSNFSKWEEDIGCNRINIINGKPFDSKKFTTVDNGNPIIRIRDLDECTITLYSTEKYEAKYKVKKGSILIGMDGDFSVVKWNNVDVGLNQRIMHVIGKNDYIDDFMYYQLMPLIHEINVRTPFSTVKHLSSNTVLNMKLLIPCLAEQQKIADCLSSFDEVIEKQKATLAAWEELKKGLLQQMFV